MKPLHEGWSAWPAQTQLPAKVTRLSEVRKDTKVTVRVQQSQKQVPKAAAFCTKILVSINIPPRFYSSVKKDSSPQSNFFFFSRA